MCWSVIFFAFVFKGRSDSETNLAAQHRNLVTALTKQHGLTGMANCMVQLMHGQHRLNLLGIVRVSSSLLCVIGK